MTRKQKRKDNESYPQWVQRLFPAWSTDQKELVCKMLKEAWFDGLRFERKH